MATGRIIESQSVTFNEHWRGAHATPTTLPLPNTATIEELDEPQLSHTDSSFDSNDDSAAADPDTPSVLP
eukprot:scaffold3766_cov28-Prasinocladus_malaysianus.AAC.1